MGEQIDDKRKNRDGNEVTRNAFSVTKIEEMSLERRWKLVLSSALDCDYRTVAATSTVDTT